MNVMSNENQPQAPTARPSDGRETAPAPRAGAATAILLVTGPSGAGRSTAIRSMEDAGFEAVDNLPMNLVPRMLDGTRAVDRPIALGVDVRTREFSVPGLLSLLDALRDRAQGRVELLYLDCMPHVLARRFSETRRRHPMAPGEDVETGIVRERALLAPLVELMHEIDGVVIDTTDLTPHELRARVQERFARAEPELSVSVQSFSYKHGLPPTLDMAFDVRFLRNPHWAPRLRPLTGRDAEVASYVAADANHDAFHGRVRDLLLSLLPAYRGERRAHLAIGFGCTGGRHRSVAVAESMAAALAEAGWRVSIRHRDLERLAPPGQREGPSAEGGGVAPGDGRSGIEGTVG
jgi:UPF0042 nucleotide-binding protein